MAFASTRPSLQGSIRPRRSPRSCGSILRHDRQVVGQGFRLRPVELGDAAFIVDLRGRAGRFLNRGASTVSEQVDWLERYFERDGDYYFVIETADAAWREGLVGVYDVDARERSAEWGRWVIEPGSSAAIESALLVYRLAFDQLALERVSCRTLSENASVVAFHDSCGLARAAISTSIEHDGERRAAVVH